MATGEVAKLQLNGLVTEVTGVPAATTACDLCVDRAFGVVALGHQEAPATFNDAATVLGDAETTSTYSVTTRATIYRCKAVDCARALIAFTSLGADRIPLNPADLHVEALPGTPDCANPTDTAA